MKKLDGHKRDDNNILYSVDELTSIEPEVNEKALKRKNVGSKREKLFTATNISILICVIAVILSLLAVNSFVLDSRKYPAESKYYDIMGLFGE